MPFLTPTIMNHAAASAGVVHCGLFRATRFFSSVAKQLFPRLPVVDDFCQHIMHNSKNPLPLSGYDLVCGQHMLLTTGSLFEALARLGGDPKRTHAAGKLYSYVDDVTQELQKSGIRVQPSTPPFGFGGFAAAYYGDIRQLWQGYAKTLAINSPRKGLVVVDDGGAVLGNPPVEVRDFFQLVDGKLKIAGLEQTSYKNGGSSMTADEVPIATVTVAGSALKALEPLFVVDVAIRESKEYLGDQKHTVVGVVGIGNIGYALCHKLRQMGYTILVNDEDLTKLQKEGLGGAAVDLETLVARSKVIFGCTGTKLAENGNLRFFMKPHLGAKTLISLSSGDVQFLGLLRKIQSMTRLGGGSSAAYYLQDVKAKLAPGTEFTLPFGGFPLNFRAAQKTGESVESRFIQVIRGALLAGVVQASEMIAAGAEPKTYMLNPEWQKFLVQSWLHHVPEVRTIIPAEQLRIFDSIESIAEHSRGILFDAASANFVRGYKLT